MENQPASEAVTSTAPPPALLSSGVLGLILGASMAAVSLWWKYDGFNFHLEELIAIAGFAIGSALVSAVAAWTKSPVVSGALGGSILSLIGMVAWRIESNMTPPWLFHVGFGLFWGVILGLCVLAVHRRRKQMTNF